MRVDQREGHHKRIRDMSPRERQVARAHIAELLALEPPLPGKCFSCGKTIVNEQWKQRRLCSESCEDTAAETPTPDQVREMAGEIRAINDAEHVVKGKPNYSNRTPPILMQRRYPVSQLFNGQDAKAGPLYRRRATDAV